LPGVGDSRQRPKQERDHEPSGWYPTAVTWYRERDRTANGTGIVKHP